jgi:hypothetical protein
MMEFVRQGNITGDLTEVPGIGPKAAEKLAEGDEHDQITNTWQLLGKVRLFTCNASIIQLLWHLMNILYF